MVSGGRKPELTELKFPTVYCVGTHEPSILTAIAHWQTSMPTTTPEIPFRTCSESTGGMLNPVQTRPLTPKMLKATQRRNVGMTSPVFRWSSEVIKGMYDPVSGLGGRVLCLKHCL